jgi:serine/threonine protein phosphatase PrpC
MIIAEQPHLNVAAATHPGRRAKANEDRYSVTAYQTGADDHTPSVLAILADGIGGHRAGEVAAQLAIENINKYVANSPTSQPALVLKQALTHTNQLILNFAASTPALQGMGTTCVCAWVIGERLYAASVGDSRLYLLRQEDLIRLTTDHTWVQETVARGALTLEQAKIHPNAHVIHRFLGSAKPPHPDLRLRLNPTDTDLQAEANQGFLLLPGDRLILCTDGLTDLISDEEILQQLRINAFEHAPAQLIDLANQRGGHDNITIVTLEVPRLSTGDIPTSQKPRQVKPDIPKNQPATLNWWMIGLVLMAIILMVSLLFYLSNYK